MDTVTYYDGSECSFDYLPSGERIADTCSPTRYYGHDFLGSSGYGDVVAEYTSTGTRRARFTHGPGIDEPLALRTAGVTYRCPVTRMTNHEHGPRWLPAPQGGNH